MLAMLSFLAILRMGLLQATGKRCAVVSNILVSYSQSCKCRITRTICNQLVSCPLPINIYIENWHVAVTSQLSYMACSKPAQTIGP
jgi:hypothetical protein